MQFGSVMTKIIMISGFIKKIYDTDNKSSCLKELLFMDCYLQNF